MLVEQSTFTLEHGWQRESAQMPLTDAQLVIVFASRHMLAGAGVLDTLHLAYPSAIVLGCSTAGEIHDINVNDDTISVTAVHFENTRVRGGLVRIESADASFEAGQQLAAQLAGESLVHVLVLSDGLHVNGSDLVRGLSSGLPPEVSVTGGLAGDGDRFEETLVVWNDEIGSNMIAAVGLYGDSLEVGCGSGGGWDSFGPERLITHSKGNVLYELDGRSALDLYKQYLGEHANGLPATGLLFPLSLRGEGDSARVVRTILSVDEATQSLIFAGDVPQGSYAQLMKANFDRLIDGAVGAAMACTEAMGRSQADLGILISCVGRKMVLKQRVEEEVEGVADTLGGVAALTGFYSYGEISPFATGARCELHNQTMTITTLSER